MDVKPLALAAVPDAGLLRLAAARAALGVDVLRQPDVRDAGGVFSDEVNVRVQDSGVHGFVVLT